MEKQPTKRKKAAHDFAVTAFRVVEEATKEGKPKKVSPSTANRGKARAAKLTPERRREIARKAAQARWKQAP